MDHNDVRHRLSEYIDDAVSPEERAAIEEHLASCSTCSNALQEIRKTIEHMRAVPEIEPPAGMASKIMAKVRDERERKSVFRRLFFPLAIKAPLQAVAVLFLVVTAFYIYQGMRPETRYSEAPPETLAKTETPAMPPKALTRKGSEASGKQEAQAQRSPGYTALDMKNEYERPAPPVPAVPRAEVREAAPQMRKNRAAVPSLTDSLLQREEQGRDKQGIDDANAMRDVTAYFTEHDLRPDMMVRGLQYSTRRLPDDLAGDGWLLAMRSYQRSSCKDRYIVDVELAGNSSKYLYCYHRGRVSLIGAYDLISGVWMERK